MSAAPFGPAALTVFAGRCGDRNPYGMAGADLLGARLAERLDLPAVRVGRPRPPLAADWAAELRAARPDLARLATRLEAVLAGGCAPLTTLGRCAAALATLPVVARHRPDAVILWFDAHGDCLAPQTSTTGYLGGMVLSGASGAWTSGLGAHLDLARVVLVGARDLEPLETALVAAGALRSVPPGPGLPERLCDAVGRRPIYVHLDCDVLEPGHVPTEYRVAGGLSLGDLRQAAEALSGLDLVGLEIAEFEADPGQGDLSGAADTLIDALMPWLARFRRQPIEA